MRIPQSPTVRRRRLGAELRQLRERAELTIQTVAKHLECSDTKISRIETGKHTARVRDVRDMLDLYGLDDGPARDALLELAKGARERGWWAGYEDVLPSGFETYVGLEADAQALRVFCLSVHGLLQTEDMARALIRAARPTDSADHIDRLVSLRMKRQEVLTRTDPAPLELWIVLDEAALRRPVGGPDVMRAQLLHLVEAAEMPNVMLQVLPFSKGAHSSLVGGFIVIEFPGTEDHEVGYVEGPAGNLYVEKPADVRRFAATFDRLRSTALDYDESMQFIRTAAKET